MSVNTPRPVRTRIKICGLREAEHVDVAVAAGADGLLIEVHPNPSEALSDAAQQLKPDTFAQLMRDLKMLAPAVGRTV